MHQSLSKQLTYTTIRIECELNDGSTSTGTGFFFNFHENKKQGFAFPTIITNKHVTKNAVKGRLTFTLVDQATEFPLDRNHLTLNIDKFEDRWIKHPDENVDLCAMPITDLITTAFQNGTKIFYTPFNRNILPSSLQIKEFSALEEVLMIGYPNGIWDEVNNMPILRKGITATHPALDYNNKKEIMLDIAAFPGSSGSPVLVFNEGNPASGIKSQLILLGILYAGPQFTAKGEIIMSPNLNKPIAISHIPNNLGLIIKAEELLAFEKLFPIANM